jgi:hypothetical protein
MIGAFFIWRNSMTVFQRVKPLLSAADYEPKRTDDPTVEPRHYAMRNGCSFEDPQAESRDPGPQPPEFRGNVLHCATQALTKMLAAAPVANPIRELKQREAAAIEAMSAAELAVAAKAVSDFRATMKTVAEAKR